MLIHDLNERIAFSEPFVPQLLFRDDRSKAMLICLEAGQGIAAHSEGHQGFFCVLEGEGTFLSDAGDQPVAQGNLVVALAGSTRGFRADKGRLVVLATAVLG